MTSQRLVLQQFGSPADALRLESVEPPPAPGPAELLLHVQFAPINPSDLNVIEGTYGTRPELPAVAGGEASARVAAVGDQLASRFQEGDQVVVLKRPGAWGDAMIAGAEDVLPVPADLDPVQAAMLSINPPTAVRLLDDFASLKPGDWIAQNAANSGVGRCVIQLAKARGLRTLNFVRRESLAEELTALGADAVIVDDENAVARGREIADIAPAVAFNAVGGDSALRLMDLLAPGGTHITYGAMSRRSLKVPNKFLIFKDLTLCGFWLTRWFDAAPREAREKLFADLAEAVAAGTLIQPVDEIFGPEDYLTALERASQGERSGKVLLRFAGAA